MIIGLTGGIGSGKSTVAKMFLKFDGVVLYHADEEAKRLMNNDADLREQLCATFGDETYTAEGILNRQHLASIVFKDASQLAKLNAIVHPAVHRHLQHFIASHQEATYILYENAILFENGSSGFCDSIITVTAPIATRIERVMQRDQCSAEDVQNRMDKQWAENKKILQSNYIINNQDLTKTAEQVLRIHNFLTTKPN